MPGRAAGAAPEPAVPRRCTRGPSGSTRSRSRRARTAWPRGCSPTPSRTPAADSISGMNLPSLPPEDPGHHVAQVNVARLLAPLDSPALRGFVEGLEPINALADANPGFVWRLQTEAGDATSIRPYDDDRIMVNLSVWRSLPALWEFVYASRHLDLVSRRRGR